MTPTKRSALFTALLALILGACTQDETTNESHTSMNNKSAALSYPESKRGSVTDTYHGVQVADPYRWMEDADLADTQEWVAAQNQLAEPYLEALPLQEVINQRMTQLWNYESYTKPRKYGDYYFYRYNNGNQNQSIVYVTTDLDTTPRPFIDPMDFSEDGTVALYQVEPSPDGTLVAYSLSDGGSDWRTWRVRNTETGQDLDDFITYTKFTSVSWTPDGRSFYYSRYPAKSDGVGDGSKAVSVYRHRIGQPQINDVLVYSVPENPRYNPYAEVTENGKQLVIGISEGYNANAVHLVDSTDPDNVVRLMDDWDALYWYLGQIDNELYFVTTNQAPNWRVIAVDPNTPSPANWREVVATTDEAIDDAKLTGGQLFINYLRDAKSFVQVHSPAGELLTELALPGIGTVSGFDGSSDTSETFFSFESFTEPPSVYRYDLSLGEAKLFKNVNVEADFSKYQTEQVFYSSKDGTRVPMFIISPKNITRDGSNPTLLYGYGGFDISLTPDYKTAYIVWLEMGGVVAIPNLRGGGEYGKQWHKAGTKTDKQNVFDDFIAAAEFLIEQGYTSSQHLGISGRSNGGLLVGAALTQRPDLFGAALPAVGVLDMLRYHTPSANARAWSSDYGLSENAEEFAALYAYSPVHNVNDDTCYPPTLVTTADRDDRVVPWHSYKFAAELQHRQACEHPVLARIETRAGHGAGKPKWMIIEDYAYQWAFLAEHLDATMP
ncbi:MAG: prolyl oligopeptidase family serine peptidase [Pseudomonadota bacterium]